MELGACGLWLVACGLELVAWSLWLATCKVRELQASGHYIIITTSRLMEEHGGNVNAVIAACGNVTLGTLADLEIPYDEI